MISKEDILTLNESLKKGDQKAIANASGLSVPTVNRFLNGNEECVSDESAALIIEAAAAVIKKRNKLNAASEKLIKSIRK